MYLGNEKSNKKAKQPAKILVKDDAWVTEKDVGMQSSINTPIPGLIVKSQFQRDAFQK